MSFSRTLVNSAQLASQLLLDKGYNHLSRSTHTVTLSCLPQDADEIAQEGQPDKAVWSLEPEDDSAEFLIGPDAWTADERADREAFAKKVQS